LLPQLQVTSISLYFGWMPSFMIVSLNPEMPASVLRKVAHYPEKQ